ncbi:MAG TPA: hypothetical protein VGK67_28675 [Myxococcales bacterium]|jgi:hypothetical protein
MTTYEESASLLIVRHEAPQDAVWYMGALGALNLVSGVVLIGRGLPWLLLVVGMLVGAALLLPVVRKFKAAEFRLDRAAGRATAKWSYRFGRVVERTVPLDQIRAVRSLGTGGPYKVATVCLRIEAESDLLLLAATGFRSPRQEADELVRRLSVFLALPVEAR